MSVAFSRVYVDVPRDTHDRLKERAKSLGKSMKSLLAELIERECSAGSSTTKPKRGKK